jgi:hypothetical protein
MFPGASGPSATLALRRKILDSSINFPELIPRYGEVEQRMKDIAGHTDRVHWLTIKEILTCHLVHGIAYPEGLTVEDEQFATMVSSRVWGVHYKVTVHADYGYFYSLSAGRPHE